MIPARKMNKNTAISILLYSLLFALMALEPVRASSLNLVESERYKVSLSHGVRQESLLWNINTSGINVLSELDWKNIKSQTTRLDLVTRLNSRFNIIAYYETAAINGGGVRDSDYCQPNHGSEFSRSFTKGEGDLEDFGAALSIPLVQYSEGFNASAFFGFSRHEQNFKMRSGVQVLNDNTVTCINGFQIPPLPAVGQALNLNSSYDAVWEGTWLGVRMNYKRQHLIGSLNVNVHAFQGYKGKGVWDQRDFSFVQLGNSYGINIGFFAGMKAADKFTVGLFGDYGYFESGGGDEHIHDRDINAPGHPLCQQSAEFCVAPGSFNGAEWTAWRLGLSLIISPGY